MDLFWEFLYLWLTLGFLVLGFIFGRIAEQRHLKSLAKREAELADIMVISDRNAPNRYAGDTGLVMGSVVLSNDYFKLLLAGIRGIFGGNIKSYETLLMRARREAILRMKAEARQAGARSVYNVKLNTSIIGEGGRKQTTSVEVLAYGTAVY